VGSRTKIFDTRKTTPCMRILERHAVRMGGGYNHRFNLNDQVLIKDNHIKACGGIANALRSARTKNKGKMIEIEIDRFEDLKEALTESADIILLDNMDYKTLKKAIDLIGNKAIVEISGGVTLQNIKRFSGLNADRISVGAITHSARAIDFSIEIE
jgi:nicotinate-nucleotide pyrophosphorylase (carboxylating)